MAFYREPIEGINGSLPLGEKKKKNSTVVLIEEVHPNSLPLEKILVEDVSMEVISVVKKTQEKM